MNELTRIQPESAASSNTFSSKTLLDEFRQTLSLRRFWLGFAWEDIKTSYRRTFFGVLWITITFLAFVGVKALIFMPIMESPRGPNYFILYLTFGVLVWQFMNNIVNSATTIFQGFEGWIRNDPIPISGYPVIIVIRCLFNLFLTAIAAVAVLAFYRYPVGLAALTLIPALFLTIWTSYAVTLLIGVISLRFRDFGQFMQTTIRVTFFLTPIFWFPEALPNAMKYLWWNPFTHFLWLFRTPVLDNEIPVDSWIFTSVLALIVTVLAFALYARFRKRMVFWF